MGHIETASLFVDVKKDFPILDSIKYLDNAATSQKPLSVINTITNFYSNLNANVHRSIHRLGEAATQKYESARKSVQRFINASSEKEIIFTSGATEAINLVASSFGEAFISEGDRILVSETEHHSNLIPWQRIAEKYNAQLEFIPLNNDYSYSEQKIVNINWEKIKIVALSHLSNVLGQLNNVEAVIKTAHHYGVPVLLDGAQSVPHISVDVQALDCDFFAFSGHKMCGPLGIGVLYGKKTWLGKLPPFKGGGDMILSVWKDHAEYNELPYKFEAGTPNIVGAIGLAEAVNYLSGIGMNVIKDYLENLSDYTAQQFKELQNYMPLSNFRTSHGIFSFVHHSIHPHDLAQFLDSRNIAIRAGHHCAQPLHRLMDVKASARASAYFYNTKEDIDTLINALLEAERFFHV